MKKYKYVWWQKQAKWIPCNFTFFYRNFTLFATRSYPKFGFNILHFIEKLAILKGIGGLILNSQSLYLRILTLYSSGAWVHYGGVLWCNCNVDDLLQLWSTSCSYRNGCKTNFQSFLYRIYQICQIQSHYNILPCNVY